MVLKLPPPPPMAKQDPTFNRWLLEITSILSDGGSGVDPSQIPGYAGLLTTVSNLQILVAGLQVQLNALQFQVSGQAIQINALLIAVTALQNRNQVFNGTAAPGAGLGVDGDWFYNRTGAAGARLYIKVGGAWSAQAV